MGMTPTQLEDLVRQRMNVVGDTFWSSAELRQLMWIACFELARECMCIERTYTTTSVANQRDYDYPSNTIAIKRVTYDGEKLEPITWREDDALTLNDTSTSNTGTPKYYAVWNNTLYLRPTPDTSALDIEIFSYNQPQEITATSSFEIPEQFIPDIQYYLLAAMASKEGDVNKAQYYQQMWDRSLVRAKTFCRKARRTDSFAAVQDQETLPLSIVGMK